MTCRRSTGTTAALLLLACGAPASPSLDLGGTRDLASPSDQARPPDPDDLALGGPARLSETGLYADIAQRTLAPGVFRYAVHYPLWSDGAEKERYLLLPGTAQIDTSDLDSWTFPVGTKAWKQFTKNGVVVETRLLMKVASANGGDSWWKMAYLWNDAGTEAYAVPAGQDDARGTTHRVPSQNECSMCHNQIADTLIGVSAIQLSSALGSGGALSQLAAQGRLTNAPATEFSPPGQGVTQDALGYLHGNCGHCHSDTANLQHVVKMRLRLHVSDASPNGTSTYFTTLNRKAAHVMPNVGDVIITPGVPEKSQLYARLGSRDLWQMPPVCTKEIDVAGLVTIHDWIVGLQ